MKSNLIYAYEFQDRYCSFTSSFESTRDCAITSAAWLLDIPKLLVIKNLTVIREYIFINKQWALTPMFVPYKVYVSSMERGDTFYKNLVPSTCLNELQEVGAKS